jgi:hypothetical protein
MLTKESHAAQKALGVLQRMERVKRFELSTSTLARLHSTPELHPLTGYSEKLAAREYVL